MKNKIINFKGYVFLDKYFSLVKARRIDPKITEEEFKKLGGKLPKKKDVKVNPPKGDK